MLEYRTKTEFLHHTHSILWNPMEVSLKIIGDSKKQEHKYNLVSIFTPFVNKASFHTHEIKKCPSYHFELCCSILVSTEYKLLKMFHQIL
jgi:hypothetical protein